MRGVIDITMSEVIHKDQTYKLIHRKYERIFMNKPFQAGHAAIRQT